MTCEARDCQLQLTNESFSGDDPDEAEARPRKPLRTMVFLKVGEGGEDLRPNSWSLPAEAPRPSKLEPPAPMRDRPLKAHGSGKTTSGKDSRKKFVFNGLTIDVDAANKQLTSGKAGAAKDHAESVATQQFDHSESNSLGFVKQFYQEQIDKLSAKNELLLRENERLKLELRNAQSEAAEAASLRDRVAELERRVLFDCKERSHSSQDRQGLYHSQSSVLQNKEEHSADPKTAVDRCPHRDKSKSPSNSSQDRKNFNTPEPFVPHFRKATSGNVSIEAKENKDTSYLRDFITKLKQTGESFKGASGHKKTSSLTGVLHKRKDLAGYYLGQTKTSNRPAPKAAGLSYHAKGHYSLQMKFDQRLQTAHPAEREAPERQALEDSKEIPLSAVDFRKDRGAGEHVGTPAILVRSGKSYQEYTQSTVKKPADLSLYRQMHCGSGHPI